MILFRINSQKAKEITKRWYEEALREIEKIDGLITIGRQGLYTYANIDEAMKMGMIAADLISREDGKINYKETFGDYLFY